MQRLFSGTKWGRAARLVAAAACVAVVLGATDAAADDPPSCYTIELSALTGPQKADLALDITAAAGCADVATLKKVQLKIYAADGSLDDVRILQDVPAPGGRANIQLGELERQRRIEADVLVQTGTPSRTYVVRGETITLLRPDLVVAAVRAPLQTLTTRQVDVQAEIAEVNGDSTTRATATLLWGPTPLGKESVTVTAGGRASVSFANVELTTPVPIELTVLVSDASPAETDETNNSRSTTVDVTEHELARSRLLVDGLGGFGTQFNQHVFAPVTPASPATLPDLERRDSCPSPSRAHARTRAGHG